MPPTPTPPPAYGLDDEVEDTAVVWDIDRLMADLRREATAAPAPGGERRLSPRRPARRVGVVVRKGTPGSGRDLGIELADAAADGLGLRLRAPVDVGDEVSVELSRPGVSRPLSLTGDVQWCRPEADGTFAAGVRLRRRLTDPELANLAG